MGREDDSSSGGGASRTEREMILNHASTQIFQWCEGAVTFVEMHHGGSDTDGLQGTHAANPQQQFLTDADLLSGGVESGGQLAIGCRVFREIGVQQQQTAASCAESENSQPDQAVGQFHSNPQRLSVGHSLLSERQLRQIELRPGFLLPSLSIEALMKKTFVVEERKSQHGDPEVRGTFQVISGKYPESTGIDWQAFMKPEFGGKEGHGTCHTRQILIRPCGAGLQVDLLAFSGCLQLRQQLLQGGGPVRVLGFAAGQQAEQF